MKLAKTITGCSCAREALALAVGRTSIFEKLVEDPDSRAREGLAQNPNATVEIFLKLAEGPDLKVRQFLARNPSVID